MSLIQNLINAASAKLKLESEAFKKFFKKPPLLLALYAAVFTLLNKILPKIGNDINKIAGKNFTDDEVELYVKNNRDLQKFLNFVGSEYDDSAVSEIVVACGDPEYDPNKIEDLLSTFADENLSGDDFINIANEKNDFDAKTNIEDEIISRKLRDITNKISGILPWIFMTYYIGLKVKEFMSQNEYPSNYRGKFLQKMIRSTSTVLKKNIQPVSNTNLKDEGQASTTGTLSTLKTLGKEELVQAKQLLESLKALDTVIGAVLMGTFIYFHNRKLVQENSLKNFAEEVSSQTCDIPEQVLTDEETRVKSNDLIPTLDLKNLSPDELNLAIACFDCSTLQEDDYIVPHVPIELVDISQCEIPVAAEEEENPPVSKSDLATRALFENKTKKNFNILVKNGTVVDNKTVLAIYDNGKIYSPLMGIVFKTEENKIFMKDIVEPSDSYLESIIQKNQEYYNELNNIKFFLKDFYVESMYPVMLRNAPSQNSNKIRYILGGITERWQLALDKKKSQNEDFENKAKYIASADNVKIKAEAEQLNSIKEDLDKEQEKLFSLLKADVETGINQSKITLSLDSEFNLIDFYFKLVESLITYYDKNSTINTFLLKMQEFLVNRFFIDKFSLDNIKDRIQNFCKELNYGNPNPFVLAAIASLIPDYYSIINARYKSTAPSDGVKTKSVENYLKELGKKNKDTSETRKSDLISIIQFLFDFSMQIEKLKTQGYTLKTTNTQATNKEAIFINDYFNLMWKKYGELQIKIEESYKEMDEIFMFFNTYSTIEIKDDEYRYYGIAEESNCPKPVEENEYLSPHSKITPDNILYWLKYCSFATLASVANPAQGWATGLPPPIGPLKLPIVYIPIKAFQLPWGFMVIGLTICGMFPFPFILFVNYTSEYHMPFADPVQILKREITALKKAIGDSFKAFKKDFIKSYLDKIKRDVDSWDQKLLELNEAKVNNKLNKPKLDRTLSPIERKLVYAELYSNWEISKIAIEEEILDAKTKKWGSEKKYKILKELYDGTIKGLYKDKKIEVDPAIISIQTTEENLDNQLQKLSILEISLSLALAPLPLATNPGTANFAMTAKNPQPLIKIESNINDTLNTGSLNKIISKFELKNEDLMNTNAIKRSTASTIKFMKKDLVGAMTILVQIDPFPKYENLKPSNLPWMMFLLTSWAPTGGKTYGIPGFP